MNDNEELNTKNKVEPISGKAKGWSNLIPVKKGQVLNVKGQSKGRTARSILTWIGRRKPPNDLAEVMRRKFNMERYTIDNETAILLCLTYMAMKGDLRAIELWLDRKYGKVTTQIDVTTTNPGPLVQILNAPAGDRTMTVIRDVQAKKIIDVSVESNSVPTTYPTKDE